MFSKMNRDYNIECVKLAAKINRSREPTRRREMRLFLVSKSRLFMSLQVLSSATTKCLVEVGVNVIFLALYI